MDTFGCVSVAILTGSRDEGMNLVCQTLLRAHLDHIVEVLERWTKSHTVAELVEKGQLMRFPWAEVTSVAQLMASPQLEERHFFVEVEHPALGSRYKFPGAPCKLSRSPWRVGSHIATRGEHNMEVYHGELGLSKQDLEALIKEGVI